jgi:hypothetical protein
MEFEEEIPYPVAINGVPTDYVIMRGRSVSRVSRKTGLKETLFSGTERQCVLYVSDRVSGN